MEGVFAAVDARPKRRQVVTGQTIEAQMRGTMCQITEYELDTLRDEIARLTAERDQEREEHTDTLELLDQALSRAAAAAMEMRERAVKWHEEVVNHDQGGIDYSDAVGIPISNRHELEQSVKAHSYSARELRALPLDLDAQKALDRLLAKAREDAIREAADIVNKNRDISGWVSHDAILALLNDGGRDE